VQQVPDVPITLQQRSPGDGCVPSAAQTQMPFMQSLLAQSAFTVQLAPVALPSHLWVNGACCEQCPWQQSASTLHVSPMVVQVHLPPAQSPERHSSSLEHAAPGVSARHSFVVPTRAHRLVQQSLSAAQVPRMLQQTPLMQPAMCALPVGAAAAVQQSETR
jgi:hypothetical protein